MAGGVVAEIVLPFTFILPMHALTAQPHFGTHSLECVPTALLDEEAKLVTPRMMAEARQWLA
jgi:hypothetical protein